MDSKQKVPWGTRESTPVERILDLHASASSVKQESPGFSHGECQSGNWVDDITFISEFPRPRNCPLVDADDFVEFPMGRNGNDGEEFHMTHESGRTEVGKVL